MTREEIIGKIKGHNIRSTKTRIETSYCKDPAGLEKSHNIRSTKTRIETE